MFKLDGDLHAFSARLMQSNDVGLFLDHQVPSLHNVRIFYRKIIDLGRLEVLTLVVRKLDGCEKICIFVGGFRI
jgi:hypothetical protein